MRFSLPATGCAVALTLLAGCSSSQNAATVPFSGLSAQTSQGAGAFAASGGSATALERLKLQVAGRLPAPAPPQAMAFLLRYYESHPHQAIRATGKGTVVAWATNQLTDYVIGFNATLQHAVVAVVTDPNGGSGPVAIKIDHNQNLWVADQYNAGGNGGIVQEYEKTGAFKAGYLYNPNNCGTGSVTYCFDTGYDSAENANYVFAGEAQFKYQDGSGATDNGSGIFRFTSANPSGKPKYYPVSDYKSNLNCLAGACDQVFYMDVDNSGNVWFDFMHRGPSYQPSSGLGELTKAGVVKIVKSAGTWVFPGGVYVSNGGKVLNVTDQNDRKTYRFHLPVTATSKAFRVIGPTPANAQGLGDPVSGGFDATDANVIFGDAYGWLDTCIVSTNTCKAVPNINFPGTGASGAAYTPSDK